MDDYIFSLEQVKSKSPLARNFLQKRDEGNAAIEADFSKITKRFYNIDTNAYMPGALDRVSKELIGLSVSAGLRCDDCIFYHTINLYQLGINKEKVLETLDIVLVIAGSIFIPHMRRVKLLIDELWK